MVRSGRKWGIFMLIGEYRHNIDDKGRLIIPSKFRDELGPEFILTRGLDGCLFIYSMDKWNNIISKLEKLPFTKKDARTFMRFFLSSATVCCLDKQGRININISLINYAKIQKECTIIGVNDRLEIWASEKLDDILNSNIDNFSEIAEGLFEGDFDA